MFDAYTGSGGFIGWSPDGEHLYPFATGKDVPTDSWVYLLGTAVVTYSGEQVAWWQKGCLLNRHGHRIGFSTLAPRELWGPIRQTLVWHGTPEPAPAKQAPRLWPGTAPEPGSWADAKESGFPLPGVVSGAGHDPVPHSTSE